MSTSHYQQQVKHPLFAKRLKNALKAKQLQCTPSAVVTAFNNYYKNTQIKAHTARKWLLGETKPRGETLILIAQWLDISPLDLVSDPQGLISNKVSFEFDFTDQEVISKYLAMTVKQKITVRLVIDAITDNHR
jgi:hypothetical protein